MIASEYQGHLMLRPEKIQLSKELAYISHLQQRPSIHDVKMGHMDNDLLLIESWKKAYAMAHVVDNLDYDYYRGSSEVELLLLVESLIEELGKIWQFAAIIIIIVRISPEWNIWALKMLMMGYFMDWLFEILKIKWTNNGHKNLVTHRFETLMTHNYSLLKPTDIEQHMLTPILNDRFERNEKIKLGLVPTKALKKLKWDAFWEKFSPCNTQTIDQLAEYRFYTTLEHFHSGRFIAAYDNLVEPLTDPYLQSIADSIMAQVLIIILAQNSHLQEDRKSIDALIGHYASRSSLPWESEQSSVLDESTRQGIINMIAGILHPPVVTQTMAMKKNTLCSHSLFTANKHVLNVWGPNKLDLDDIQDETYSLNQKMV